MRVVPLGSYSPRSYDCQWCWHCPLPQLLAGEITIETRQAMAQMDQRLFQMSSAASALLWLPRLERPALRKGVENQLGSFVGGIFEVSSAPQAVRPRCSACGFSSSTNAAA